MKSKIVTLLVCFIIAANTIMVPAVISNTGSESYEKVLENYILEKASSAKSDIMKALTEKYRNILVSSEIDSLFVDIPNGRLTVYCTIKFFTNMPVRSKADYTICVSSDRSRLGLCLPGKTHQIWFPDGRKPESFRQINSGDISELVYNLGLVERYQDVEQPVDPVTEPAPGGDTQNLPAPQEPPTQVSPAPQEPSPQVPPDDIQSPEDSVQPEYGDDDSEKQYSLPSPESQYDEDSVKVTEADAPVNMARLNTKTLESYILKIAQEYKNDINREVKKQSSKLTFNGISRVSLDMDKGRIYTDCSFTYKALLLKHKITATFDFEIRVSDDNKQVGICFLRASKLHVGISLLGILDSVIKKAINKSMGNRTFWAPAGDSPESFRVFKTDTAPDIINGLTRRLVSRKIANVFDNDTDFMNTVGTSAVYLKDFECTTFDLDRGVIRVKAGMECELNSSPDRSTDIGNIEVEPEFYMNPDSGEWFAKVKVLDLQINIIDPKAAKALRSRIIRSAPVVKVGSLF